MFPSRAVRTSVAAAAAWAALLGPAAQAAAPPARTAPPAAALPAPGEAAGSPGDGPAHHGDGPAHHGDGAGRDGAEHRAAAPRVRSLPAPEGAENGRVPGPVGQGGAPTTAPRPTAGGTACTLDAVSALGPEPWADFLTDPAVLAGGCLRGLLWTWDDRLAPLTGAAHVQAASRRAEALSPGHDGRGGSHLEELFTYLHAVAHHASSRPGAAFGDPPALEAVRRAVAAFAAAPRSFDATGSNARTLREALYTAGAPGLRHHQLPLVRRVLGTAGPDRAGTRPDPAWAGAVRAGLTVNHLGLSPGDGDGAFRAAAASDPGYRAAFREFAGHTHLRGTAGEGLVREALAEYGRFSAVGALRESVAADLGALLEPVRTDWGEGSGPWASLAAWLIRLDACRPHGVCREDIERRLFPRTDRYDNGALVVRTALPRTLVDRLYYAAKQVSAQFHRVLGTSEPLADDPGRVLTVVLYASRSEYEVHHPLLTGLGSANGGIYIERGATLYTYQRRVPQDSSLTLEELFRHEYTHYLNGRYAIPGLFGEGPWYRADRTTAVDEGTAEFFAGSTRDDGVAVRRSLVRDIAADTASRPRMTVAQILDATYAGDGFRFYGYAGTLFSYLWSTRPALLGEMYAHLRAGDVAAFDGWRRRAGADADLQRGYDRFLDEQIAAVEGLFVPDTSHAPVDRLRYGSAAEVRAAFSEATRSAADCASNGDPGRPRFVCTGRITADLSQPRSPDRVLRDMAEAVDASLLDRARPAADNLADMNCSFGPVGVRADRAAGTSAFRCEGPLRG
ncbi:collagenase [Streptomyces sp. NPDC048001]|uniref:collagenase n=1 Tax=unclassified Streptomyces TaxID=2593676 RepID=UPI0037166302